MSYKSFLSTSQIEDALSASLRMKVQEYNVSQDKKKVYKSLTEVLYDVDDKYKENGIVITYYNGKDWVSKRFNGIGIDDFTNTEKWIDAWISNIPEIGDNGNWFINGQDTGMPSKGRDGENGVSLGEIVLANELSTDEKSKESAISQYAVSKDIFDTKAVEIVNWDTDTKTTRNKIITEKRKKRFYC